MKQIMFSTVFPATHPRKGQPTYFVEKIWSGFDLSQVDISQIYFKSYRMDFSHWDTRKPKVHTIRAGQRWKPGDQFVGKIWSGRPYRSKTITVTPVLTVEKVWYLEIIFLNGRPRVRLESKFMEFGNFIDAELAVNDGLSYRDFVDWFKPKTKKAAGFYGQIICWSKNVNYG